MTDHLDYLLDAVEPLAPFGMSLVDAWNLALCEDIKSECEVPSEPLAEVDGYAFSIEDVVAAPPGARPTLRLAQKTDAVARAIGVGEAAPVKAGDPLPLGADTVVADWQAAPDDDDPTRLRLKTKVVEGDWVRPVGAEAREGQLLVKAGTLLNDRRSALLAAAGFTRVLARPRTRVALVQVDDADNPDATEGGRSAAVGVHLVNGAARNDGATVWRVHIDLTDLPTAREHLSDELIRADLVLTVGGLTEAGPDPRLLNLLNSMGAVEVVQVAMRPGQMHGFGKISDENTPVLMLPGDAVALMAAYHAFARPVLRKLMGSEPFAHEPMLCFAERDIDAELDVTELLPCRLRQDGNRYLASEIAPRRHSMLPTLVAADALVVLPGDKGRVYAGEALAAWLLDDQRIVSQ